MIQWKAFRHAESSLNETSLYKDRVVPAKFTKSEKKFRWLFTDAFGHHVQLDTTKRISEQLDLIVDDHKRLIEQDEVSALFRERFVDGFKISETANESEQDILDNILSDWMDVEEICDPSVAFPYKKHKGFGNNRLSLLIGNAGQGKSLLLTKILSDYYTKHRIATQGRPLLVYVNLESAWIKEGDGVFKDIDDSFWELLFRRLTGQCPKGEENIKLREELSSISMDSILSWEYKLRDACRILPEYGYFSIIVIDNIDRYHFSEVRHSFFEEYKNEQVESIQKNISRIISKFNDLDALGRISASVIIVCRRPVYDHLIISADGSDPNDNRLKGYSVYQLLEPGTSQIIYPRIATLKYVIDRELQLGRLPKTDIESVETALSVLSAVTVERPGYYAPKDGLKADVCDLLLDLSHQGPRGVIQFLSEFEFDIRRNSEAIDRIFRSQPRNLLRLYISNCRKRYSQAAQHFPNLFLNDCSIDRNPKYPAAYVSHRQSYWLKWIVLRLIDNSPGNTISFENIHHMLCKQAGYEDHLLRLVIGSLATPNKSGCISVQYRNHTVDSRHLSLTRRGAALVNEQHANVLMGVPFCFSFDYLQLVADDPQMSYPNQWADEIVPEEVCLDYALRESDEYHRRALQYLRVKMPATLIFARLLEASWVRELKFINQLPAELKAAVTPDFEKISETLLSAYKAILSSWSSDGELFYLNLVKKRDKLKADSSFNQFWEFLND